MCIELKSLGLFLYLIASYACVFSIDQSCMLLDSVLKLRSLLCNGAWFSLARSVFLGVKAFRAFEVCEAYSHMKPWKLKQ